MVVGADGGGAGSDGGSEASLGIHGEGTFDVEVTEDVIYAQGLVHADWRSAESMPMDLLLDVYQPVRDNPPKMPVIVFIRGGAFQGGSHKNQSFKRWRALLRHEAGWLYHRLPCALTQAGPCRRISGAARRGAQYGASGPMAMRFIQLLPGRQGNQPDSLKGKYSINTDYITALGGQLAHFIAVALGVTNEDDCVNDVSEDDDATLARHTFGPVFGIRIIDHWGGTGIVRALELMTPGARFDATDAIGGIHGRQTAPCRSHSRRDQGRVRPHGRALCLVSLDDEAHAPWRVEVGDKNLTELAFDFIVEQQGLELE